MRIGHTWRVQKIKVASNPKPSKLFGHTRLWRTLTNTPIEESVDQGGFANIGEANDCSPDRSWLQTPRFPPVIDLIAQGQRCPCHLQCSTVLSHELPKEVALE